jgi:hypothetical protein
VIDHVLYAVHDLEEAAARLLEHHGLDALEGGAHPGWGTANRIVPLADQYLELIAVVDPSSEHPIARTVGAMCSSGDRLMAVCCESADIEATAARIGSGVLPGSRTTPGGPEVTWRLAGVEAALTDLRPFFIQWDSGRSDRMGPGAAQHRVRPTGSLTVEIGGDARELRDWLGEPVDGLLLAGGAPGVRRLTIDTDQGPVTIT